MRHTELFSEKNRIFKVAELNFMIKGLLESNLPLLWVSGEISNLVKAASGHYYFSLKDETAQVRCVMFRHKSQGLEHPIRNGLQVEVLAIATVYEARGDLQLMVEQIRSGGQGTLYEQFAQLKQRLEKLGLFAAERKRPLPTYPRRIGIVTSPQAAALRDVLTTLRYRLPSVPVILYPTPVQGQGSAEKIAQAVQLANQRAECDVLIVCRGGGSIEDLWAFNEEVVAHAIANSIIPIVSGVGHETDFTIADFVADQRAPTPTAAAQQAVQDRHALQKQVEQLSQQLRRAINGRLATLQQTLDHLQPRLQHPAQRLDQQRQQLQQLQDRLARSFSQHRQRATWQYRHFAQRLKQNQYLFEPYQKRRMVLTERLVTAAKHALRQQQQRFTHLEQKLTLLNPQHVLARGYSLVQDQQGHIVHQSHQLKIGDKLNVTFAQGRIEAEVTDITSPPIHPIKNG